MAAPSSIVANLYLVLSLLRGKPAARDEQAAAFRILLASLENETVSLRAAAEGLRVDGTLISRGTPSAAELHALLTGHGLGEIVIPLSVAPAALLSLLRAVATSPGTFPTMDAFVGALDESARGMVVRPGSDGASSDTFRDFIAGTDLMATLDAAGASEPAAVFGREHEDAAQRSEELLAKIEADPVVAGVLDRLNEVVALADGAAQRSDWDEVLRIAGVLVRAEAKAGPAGRAYGIALRRVLPRSAAEPVARLVVLADRRADVVPVMRRLGAEGTEVLLGLMSSASTMAARRAYYEALRQMTEGTQLLVNMLTHDEWYVVRNVADLCGDLKLEEAVTNLARQLHHPDERVRRSAAGALAKIGSSATVEPLRQALRDAAPSVRLQVVRSIEGWRGRGLAMTLAVLIDEVTQPELLREMLLALGRIGTPETVQTLVRASTPGRRLFNRKPLATRVAAVEALRLAGGAGALAALQSLLADDDLEVRSAAQKALAQLSS